MDNIKPQDLKIYQFDKSKFYIIITDPYYFDFSQVDKLEFPEDINAIFIPVLKNAGFQQIEFNSLQAVIDWAKERQIESQK